jgi:hypothetical protein
MVFHYRNPEGVPDNVKAALAQVSSELLRGVLANERYDVQYSLGNDGSGILDLSSDGVIINWGTVPGMLMRVLADDFRFESSVRPSENKARLTMRPRTQFVISY